MCAIVFLSLSCSRLSFIVGRISLMVVSKFGLHAFRASVGLLLLSRGLGVALKLHFWEFDCSCFSCIQYIRFGFCFLLTSYCRFSNLNVFVHALGSSSGSRLCRRMSFSIENSEKQQVCYSLYFLKLWAPRKTSPSSTAA